MLKPHCSNFRIVTAIFGVSESFRFFTVPSDIHVGVRTNRHKWIFSRLAEELSDRIKVLHGRITNTSEVADKYKQLEKQLDDLEDQIANSIATSEQTQAKVTALREIFNKMKVLYLYIIVLNVIEHVHFRSAWFFRILNTQDDRRLHNFEKWNPISSVSYSCNINKSKHSTLTSSKIDKSTEVTDLIFPCLPQDLNSHSYWDRQALANREVSEKNQISVCSSSHPRYM